MTDPIDPRGPERPAPGRRDLRVDTASLLGGPDRFGALLSRWLADATVDQAAADRARRAFLRLREEQDTSIPAIVLTLAERGDTVVIEAGGARWRGVLVAVTADAVVMAADQGGLTVIPLSGIEVVRSEGRAVHAARVVEIPTTMLGALETAAAERHPVMVRTSSGTVLAGALETVGVDHLRLRSNDGSGQAWVPVGTIAAVTLT